MEIMGSDGVVVASRSIHLMHTVVFPPSPATDYTNDTGYIPVFEINSNFNPSMTIVIVVLLSTFFFMGFFSVYMRRCVFSNRGSEVIYQTGSVAPAQQHSAIRGLDKATIASFPAISFSRVKGIKKGRAAIDCTVCLTEFQEHEQVKILKCGHCFHIDCIDMWLFSHTTCPLCRFSQLQEEEGLSLSRRMFFEAESPAERRLEEGRSMSSSVYQEHDVYLTIDGIPTQNEADVNGEYVEATPLDTVGDREATLAALSKNSKSFRTVARDAEVTTSNSPRLDDGSPSNSASLRTSTASSAKLHHSPGRVCEIKEATLALSKNSESFRIAAQDLERNEVRSSTPPRLEDGSPSNLPGLRRSASSTKLHLFQNRSMLFGDAFKRSRPEEGREQLLDSLGLDKSFSFDHRLARVPASWTLTTKEPTEDDAGRPQ